MNGGQKQECNKQPRIPQANTITNPWTVMIVDLDADSARPTVERSGRPQYLARLAVAHFIVSVLLVHYWLVLVV